VTIFTFRPDTLDFAIFCMVYFSNEYGLPPRFEPTDIIIDIGAHIGSFAFASLVRGAGKVICVEAHPDNVTLAKQHLADYIDSGQVEVHYGAVWQSDGEQLHISAFPNYDDRFINTGGATVNIQGNGHTVTTVILDNLITDKKIRLLKLDCEGSEFSILLTAQHLHQVQEIVGEYHEHDDYTIAQLMTYLQSKGFATEYKPHQQYVGGNWITLSRGYFRAQSLTVADEYGVSSG